MTQLPTPEQLKQMASQLIDTTKNVYRVAESLGIADFDESAWDALVNQEHLFRCEDCGWWHSVNYRAYAGSDVCDECDAENNADD